MIDNDDYLNKNKQKSLNKMYNEKLQRIIEVSLEKPTKYIQKINSIDSE